MDSGNQRSVTEPSTGIAFSTRERQGEAGEHWPGLWRSTNGELFSLDRLDLLGWDEA